MISLSLDPATEQLKLDFQKWLKSNPPPSLPLRAPLEQFVAASARWQGQLAGERWIGVHWPEAFGGRGLGLTQEAVLQECLAAAGSPQLVGLFGLTMVGPVLIRHGSEDQKKRFLSKILSAEEIWCQGFSEPAAGSDLASLRTIASMSEGDEIKEWRVSGQKVWTSYAQFAQWCFMLVRSDTSAPKHKGLSYLLVPMNAAGVSIRPLAQITGDKEFNELFFDDVRIPAQNIVGKPGEGWAIAISTLMYERVILTFARHLQSEDALKRIAALSPRDGAEKANFGRLITQSMAVRALALSHLGQYNVNHQPGPEGSLDKLAWSECFQEICKFALELSAKRGGEAFAINSHDYLYSRGRTIAAGTSEIQRNIIAERVLGLPRN